jgi:ubiquinone/menaquinone biosynthesis C-methylase UbiE
MKENIDIDKAQGHWILAKMGKKVLRPGGRGLTLKMIEALQITPKHRIAEFAPGLGFTAQIALSYQPKTYTGIDLDPEAAASLRKKINGEGRKIVEGNAAETGLPSRGTDRVYGEAMLTMHADHRKAEIIREAHRILEPGGLYGIHELGLQPDTLDEATKAEIQKDLALAIRVNARPLTVTEWTLLLEKQGFKVVFSATSPMHLLEMQRMIADEGFFRTLKIGYNILRNGAARKRILDMQRVFRRHAGHMNAVALVAQKV